MNQFLFELVLPLFAHKKDKPISFIKHYKRDQFEIVNDVCENFSDVKLNAFFAKPTLAFLFFWFSHMSHDGK